MSRQDILRTTFAFALLGVLSLTALAYRITLPAHPAWVYQVQASVSDRPQTILFGHLVNDGRRLDQEDPYLPLLDDETRHGRATNFQRCLVAVDVNQRSGVISRVGFDDPRTLFTVAVDGSRWDADEILLDDLACVFAAGDVRRTVEFTVNDEHGRPIGLWRHGRYLPAGI